MVVLLDKSEIWFPDPCLAEPDGLLAIGGQLTVPWLLAAYSRGIFPWSADPITWWSPDPRAIIELDKFHVPRSLRRVLKKGMFTVTFDMAFEQVIRMCAEPFPGREETWITEPIIKAYVKLYKAGYAHSVECWNKGKLVGGVYGVAIGGFFAGESMFHTMSNASKVALYFLVERLRERHFELFDIQMVTSVTKLLGAIEIPRTEYLDRLKRALEKSCEF